MAKRCMSAALVAWGALTVPAFGQGPSGSSQGGANLMPEPIPCFEAPQNSMPPQTQMSASPLSLRGDLPNAWDQEKPYVPPAVYFSAGYLTMQRQRLGHGAAAVLDPGNGVDTGVPPPRNAPLALDFDDIQMRLNHGVRATLGYHWDSHALEVGGFYLSQSSSAKLVANPGHLDSFFTINGNFNNRPLGFEGNNGLWLQADLMRIRLQTAVGSGEVNWRWWPEQNSTFNVALGVRYVDFYERFSFFTDDDGLTVRDIFGNPNPRLQATYATTAHNRIAAPQFGLEWNQPISCWLAFTMAAKGAWGANFLDVDVNLKRGDGFQRPTGHRSDTIFSHLYEAGFFLDFGLLERMRVRAGYNLLWLVDVAEAVDQLDFNLANRTGRVNNHGSAFFHGPSVEFQFLF